MSDFETRKRLSEIRERVEGAWEFAGSPLELEPEADRRFLLELVYDQAERLSYIQEWADVMNAGPIDRHCGYDVDMLLKTPLEALRMEEDELGNRSNRPR